MLIFLQSVFYRDEGYSQIGDPSKHGPSKSGPSELLYASHLETLVTPVICVNTDNRCMIVCKSSLYIVCFLFVEQFG